MPAAIPPTVLDDVRRALAEDVGTGDLSAAAIPPERTIRATVIAREGGVLAGVSWFNAVFAELDAAIDITWHHADGDAVAGDSTLCTLAGPGRALITGERTALNFLQLLSGVATSTRRHVDAIAGTGAIILDTRKTVPGLRRAQKYAVTCGGGVNHRMGLHDGAMLKENHLHAAGGITAAMDAVRAVHPNAPLTVEVETLEQVQEALAAGARHLLLDNFPLADLHRAVAENAGRAHLEASGGVSLDTVRAVAETGVDSISVGTLTKDVRALDLSLRFAG